MKVSKNIINNLKIARGVCETAGKYLIGQSPNNFVNNSDQNKDFKSSADEIVEKIIIPKLFNNSPYTILTEETGQHGKIKNDEPYWIVDPLDGTMNYTRNFPMACISIALWRNDEPILGVVYDFNREELYSAAVGEDAKLNDKNIAVSSTDTIGQAILATGFPVKRNYDSGSLKKFLGNIQKFKKIRMIGAAALSLAYIASGVFDAYYEEDIMIWDVAAGLALVKASGGEIFIKPGSKEHSVICAATNGNVCSNIDSI